ncbi:MAG: hypothetical protein JXR48_03400 [Candidatus Delongbacteria bacterium]|nr:hypothetical protein [Candidatus Delongbacteria bacterium]MBN2833993.1 hypothetical protein [Candidatus Delongbacteria bacterium]
MKKVATKRCSHCNAIKPETDFPFKSQAKGQVDDTCRECKDKLTTQMINRRVKAKENLRNLENIDVEA